METNENDEISLLDLIAVIFKYKIMIIAITLCSSIGIVIFAFISLKIPPEKSPLPNKFRSKALMLINNPSDESSASALMAAGGAAASFLGLPKGAAATYSSLAIYIGSTNSFLDSVVDEFDLITKYKIKKAFRTASRKTLKASLSVDFDEKSGVFSISFVDIDPVFAQKVVEFAVKYYEKRFSEMGLDQHKLELQNLANTVDAALNGIKAEEARIQELERSVSYANPYNVPSISKGIAQAKREMLVQEQIYTNAKVQYELLKVKMKSEKPVFQILEMPEVPDQKSEPARGKLCIIVTFAAFFLSVFLAFFLNAVNNIRNDRKAMEKFAYKR